GAARRRGLRTDGDDAGGARTVRRGRDVATRGAGSGGTAIAARHRPAPQRDARAIRTSPTGPGTRARRRGDTVDLRHDLTSFAGEIRWRASRQRPARLQ